MRKFFTLIDPVVPVQHPRVLVETAAAQGAERAALLERSGVTEAMLGTPEARISYAQFYVLSANALRLTGNPGLGIDVGRNTHAPQMGMLGLAMMSSATVGAAQQTLFRYYRAFAPAWDFDVRVAGSRGVLCLRETVPLGVHRMFATEWLLTAHAQLGRSLYGRTLPVTRLRLNYPRPDHAARYAEIHDAPALFDQEVTELEFDASVLQAPVISADPATAKLAEDYCAQLMSITAAPPTGLVAQVRARLGSARGPLPDLEALARELQTSGRSLRRFLQQMGTSYHELAEESRRARAEEWVGATELTFEQIAGQLGFSDVRSFRRAFKRWTGRTPNEFRAARGS